MCLNLVWGVHSSANMSIRLDDPEVTVNLSEQETDEDLAVSLLSWIMSS